MPARVKVRAVIWVGDRVIVNRVSQRGELRITLPGGRVNERESVPDALRREVREELGIDINIGALLFAAEILSGPRIHDVELIFEAHADTQIDPADFELVDPANPGVRVLPPVLEEISRMRSGEPVERWLGNIYKPGLGNEIEESPK